MHTEFQLTGITYTCSMFVEDSQAIERHRAIMWHRMRCHLMLHLMWCPAQLLFSNFPSSSLCYFAASEHNRSQTHRYPAQEKLIKKKSVSHSQSHAHAHTYTYTKNAHGNTGLLCGKLTSSSMPAGMNLGFCDISATNSTPADCSKWHNNFSDELGNRLFFVLLFVIDLDVEKQVINVWLTVAQWHFFRFFFCLFHSLRPVLPPVKNEFQHFCFFFFLIFVTVEMSSNFAMPKNKRRRSAYCEIDSK